MEIQIYPELSVYGIKMSEFPGLDRLERMNPKAVPLGLSKLFPVVSWMGFSRFVMDNHKFLGLEVSGVEKLGLRG